RKHRLSAGRLLSEESGRITMPRYEFMCEECKKPFELSMAISQREKAKVKCARPGCLDERGHGTAAPASRRDSLSVRCLDWPSEGDDALDLSTGRVPVCGPRGKRSRPRTPRPRVEIDADRADSGLGVALVRRPPSIVAAVRDVMVTHDVPPLCIE